MYLFPQGDQPGTVRADQVDGAWGILIYHADGATESLGSRLGRACLNMLAILAAFLLSRAPLGSYLSRAGFVVVSGLITALMTNVQFWN